VSPALVKRYGKGTDSDATDALVVSDTVRSHPRPGSNSDGLLIADVVYALNAHPGGYRDGQGDTTYVAAPLTKGSATGEGVNAPGRRQEDDVNLVTSITLASDPISADNLAQPSTKRNGDPGVIAGVDVGVRRLTPTECERLQGFPDGWTQLGDTPDSRRYSALGDAVTVNVSEWIGRRLAA
jgi:DNA (cytosine-5)-methyltransferase 1